MPHPTLKTRVRAACDQHFYAPGVAKKKTVCIRTSIIPQPMNPRSSGGAQKLSRKHVEKSFAQKKMHPRLPHCTGMVPKPPNVLSLTRLRNQAELRHPNGCMRCPNFGCVGVGYQNIPGTYTTNALPRQMRHIWRRIVSTRQGLLYPKSRQVSPFCFAACFVEHLQ